MQYPADPQYAARKKVEFQRSFGGGGGIQTRINLEQINPITVSSTSRSIVRLSMCMSAQALNVRAHTLLVCTKKSCVCSLKEQQCDGQHHSLHILDPRPPLPNFWVHTLTRRALPHTKPCCSGACSGVPCNSSLCGPEPGLKGGCQGQLLCMPTHGRPTDDGRTGLEEM